MHCSLSASTIKQSLDTSKKKKNTRCPYERRGRFIFFFGFYKVLGWPHSQSKFSFVSIDAMYFYVTSFVNKMASLREHVICSRPRQCVKQQTGTHSWDVTLLLIGLLWFIILLYFNYCICILIAVNCPGPCTSRDGQSRNITITTTMIIILYKEFRYL